MNKAILMGRLTRDPEMRQTQSGKAVVSFSIAVGRRFQKDQTDFIECVAWNNTAEFICKWFQKGSMIAVVGSIQTRTWEDQNQNKRKITEIVVDEAYFSGEKSGGNKDDGYIPQFDADGFGEVADDDDLPF